MRVGKRINSGKPKKGPNPPANGENAGRKKSGLLIKIIIAAVAALTAEAVLVFFLASGFPN